MQAVTVFQAIVSTSLSVDLTRPPFEKHGPKISSPTTYSYSQALGASLRAEGIEALRFASARDPAGGSNIALFSPVFVRKAPQNEQGWVCTSEHAFVEFKPNISGKKRKRVRLEREMFEVDGKLPSPGSH